MKWQDKLIALRDATKDIVVGTLAHFGISPAEAVADVDKLTDALEAPVALWLTARGLPPELAAGAAHAALAYIDAAAAGLIQGQKAAHK